MEIEQTIGDNFTGTKNITVSTGGGSDLEAGIEFIYDMREHMVDIGIATVYGIVVFAVVMWIKKRLS
jgi:hypothetical protein